MTTFLGCMDVAARLYGGVSGVGQGGWVLRPNGSIAPMAVSKKKPVCMDTYRLLDRTQNFLKVLQIPTYLLHKHHFIYLAK